MHRYILGLYSLYDSLIQAFPHLLFESCSSGGARFDPGMLYYAPQAWTSDDSDAIERLKIQYGTSYVYPVSCMGAHVSAVPNAQVGRMTPLNTRFEVACYGAFGYELDLNRLTAAEKEEVRQQIALVKQYGELLQQGIFYRLLSPFGQSYASWMCINPERAAVLVSCYRILNKANDGFRILKLRGLDEQRKYTVSVFSGRYEKIGTYSGSELMYAGMGMTGLFSGKTGDFQSVTLLIEE